MNFSVLPPEVNSARMFAGAGSGPTLTAAAAWGRLADELATAASSFNSATATLAGQSWLGRAATAMAAGPPVHKLAHPGRGPRSARGRAGARSGRRLRSRARSHRASGAGRD
ncbi:PPE family protein [Mycobacterium kansasii]|uniref:PPE family protein n=1 Tax=Mycobacterium kansasii TaxID=1768 RepID=A0A1V3X1T3_MYCKA|nr:PPE family protein [Mycobacterium kansasii]